MPDEPTNAHASTAHTALLRAILDDVGARADPARLASDANPAVVAGPSFVVVAGAQPGLASRLPEAVAAPYAPPPSPTLQALARMLPSQAGRTPPTVDVSVAMAAVNALLPPPDVDVVKGQDLLGERGRGKRVALVGHFPFVDRMEHDFARVTILEKRPRPGDVTAAEAHRVLPQAEVVAITATTLLNGALAELLPLCRQAFVMLLGPTTPFAPSLFRTEPGAPGVDALAGAVVTDAEQALVSVQEGVPFFKLRGVESRVWLRPGA